MLVNGKTEGKKGWTCGWFIHAPPAPFDVQFHKLDQRTISLAKLMLFIGFSHPAAD
jgi:hypothetical protein